MAADTKQGATQSVPKGFKQTEVGIFPLDWKLIPLVDTTPKYLRYGIVDGPFGSNLKTEHYRKSGIPIITSGYVTAGVFFASEYLYVDESKYLQEKRSSVSGGDIVMAKIGARCGASAIIPEDHPDGILSGNALKITIDRDKYSRDLLAQILWNIYDKGDLEDITTTGAQPAISISNLRKRLIPLPPTLCEQQAIAEALSDMDAMIRSLERLIEKKKAIKQGAMQELLRPKEGWVLKTFGEAFEIGHGKNQSAVEDRNGQYPILGTGGFMAWANDFLYDKPSALIGRKGTIDVPRYMDTPFWTVDTLYFTKMKQGYNAKFVFYLFHTIDWYSHNEASGVPSLSGRTIENIEVHFPKDESEQVRIASLLTEMEADIETTSIKLTKTRQLKQGMMQDLLTGKKRLI